MRRAEKSFLPLDAFIAFPAVFIPFGVDTGKSKLKRQAPSPQNHVLFFQLLKRRLDLHRPSESERCQLRKLAEKPGGAVVEGVTLQNTHLNVRNVVENRKHGRLGQT